MQMKFMSNGKMIEEVIMTKVVGLRFNPAGKTLKVGQKVSVQPVEVEGFEKVLQVSNNNGVVGNILSNKGLEELEFEAFGGKVFTNFELHSEVNELTFRVKSVGKFGAVLTASF